MEIDEEYAVASPRLSPKRPVEESPVADSEGESEKYEVSHQIAKRSRKSTDRFAGLASGRKKEKAKRYFDETGEGVKLGEIEKIAEKLAKVSSNNEALKRLHRVLFGTDGTSSTRKKEIRLWNGSSSESTKSSMVTALTRAKSVAVLKEICSILSLQTSGDRVKLEERILEFLIKPSPGGASASRKNISKKRKESKKKVLSAAKTERHQDKKTILSQTSPSDSSSSSPDSSSSSSSSVASPAKKSPYSSASDSESMRSERSGKVANRRASSTSSSSSDTGETSSSSSE